MQINLRVLLSAIVLMGISSLPSLAAVPLIPQPRNYVDEGEELLPHGLNISSVATNTEDRFAAKDFIESLKERGIRIAPRAGVPTIRLLRVESSLARRLLKLEGIEFSPAMREEGYVILSRQHDLYVIGATGQGVFYGLQTVKQLITGSEESAVLHKAEIRDWPAMKYRGLDDDLSRGPIPTLDFQKKQIRTLAAYKVNIYSPYFENTFSYRQNPLPALPGGSMTPEEAQELVRYAAQYHVLVIPEQEAFGHLHHVLTFEKYAGLAEAPQGAVLAPGAAGSLELIHQWFCELAQVFPGPMLHIGADETGELGKGKTAAEVNARGLGAVYLDFLKKIHEDLAPLHRRLLFWGDIAMNEPALVKTLPKDMIAVAWEYSPQDKGYERWLRPYLDAGMETWVAPGVNNWNRVYPNNDMALRNIQEFVADGQRFGSTGLLNTIWNDDGEGLFLEDWYGVLFGAAASWQAGTSDIDQYSKSYGPVFHGDENSSLNQAENEITEAHKTLARAGLGDGKDSLFWVDPWSTDGQEVAAKLLPIASELRMHAEEALTLIAAARKDPDLRERDAVDAMDLGARRLDFIGLKFQIADEINSSYRKAYAQQNDPEGRREVGRQIGSITGVNGRCQDLRDGLSYIKEEFRDIWLRENRPYWLNNVMAKYDLAVQLWVSRGDRFETVRHRWSAEHTLPSPEELGLPPGKSK
jgi:hexosaminidase